MKRIITIIVSTILVMSFPFSMAFAQDTQTQKEVVVFENDEVIITQPQSENRASISTADDYNYAWISSGGREDYFRVTTKVSGKVGITLKVESGSTSSFATISMSKVNGGDLSNVDGVTLSTGGKSEYKTTTSKGKGTYQVNYAAYSKDGLRIMCWLY